MEITLSFDPRDQDALTRVADLIKQLQSQPAPAPAPPACENAAWPN